MTRVKPVTPAKVLKVAVETVPELRFITAISNFPLMYNVVQPCLSNLAPAMGSVREQGSMLADVVREKVLESIHDMPPIGSVLQSAWTATHTLTIFGGLGYIWYRMKLDSAYDVRALQCYNTIAISSTCVYLLVTYRHICLLLIQGKLDGIPFSIIMKSENTHLLGMSLLVLVSPCNAWKILSLFIYSFLNLSTYIMVDLFPESSLSDAMLPLLTYLEESLLITGAILDFLVIFVYFWDLLAGNTSYYVVVYSMIFCIRLENSESCRQAIKWMFSIGYYLMQGKPWTVRLVALMKVVESFLIPPEDVLFSETPEIPQTSASLVKKRIASLRFDSYYIVNDLIR